MPSVGGSWYGGVRSRFPPEEHLVWRSLVGEIVVRRHPVHPRGDGNVLAPSFRPANAKLGERVV